MPAALAACLFVSFILWLFYRNSRSAPGISGGLWIPLIWVGIMESKPVAYWFMSPQSSADVEMYLDGNPMDRNILLLLIFAGVWVLMRRPLDWGAIFRDNRWLWIFYLYLAISVLWSDFPFVAFKRWFRDLGNIVMILIIVTERDPIEALRAVFVRCAYVLVPLSVLLIKWYPDIGRYYHPWTYGTLYCGVTTNKNSLGVLAMLSGLFLLWSLVEIQNLRGSRDYVGWIRRNSWREVPALAKIATMLPEGLLLFMCVWILTIAHSSTAFGCFLLGTAALFAYRLSWAKANVRRLSWHTYGLLVFSALVLFVPDLRTIAAESMGRDATLTTRTDIWDAVLKMRTNMLVGNGFASVWLTDIGSALAKELRIPHAHNGYLEMYLNTGLIGVGLLLIVLVSAGGNATRHLARGTPAGPLYMALFLCAVIHNFTEASFNNNNIIGFCLVLVATRYWRPAWSEAGDGADAADPSENIRQPLQPAVTLLGPNAFPARVVVGSQLAMPLKNKPEVRVLSSRCISRNPSFSMHFKFPAAQCGTPSPQEQKHARACASASEPAPR